MRQLTAVGLKVATSNAIIARSVGVIGGVDFLYDGKVEKVDDASLHALLEKNIIPIIPSIGFDTKGRNYLLDSDSLAFSLGLSIESSKVMMLVDPNLINSIKGHQYSVSETVDLVKDAKNLAPRLSRMLLTAAKSFDETIERVHILNGFSDYAILAELFSNEGVGIMIHRDPYGEIRSANEGDISEVLSIIQSAILDDELIPRELSDISAKIKDFYVLEIDGNVVGTVAIHSSSNISELACLFVKKSHEGVGYGKRLVGHAVDIAKEKGSSKIYALSTQASGFFEKLGWEECKNDGLPKLRKKELIKSGRNSKVFMCTLN